MSIVLWYIFVLGFKHLPEGYILLFYRADISDVQKHFHLFYFLMCFICLIYCLCLIYSEEISLHWNFFASDNVAR